MKKIKKVLDFFADTVYNINIFLDSSMVEHTAVNRGVVGSSPTRGVIFLPGCLFKIRKQTVAKK